MSRVREKSWRGVSAVAADSAGGGLGICSDLCQHAKRESVLSYGVMVSHCGKSCPLIYEFKGGGARNKQKCMRERANEAAIVLVRSTYYPLGSQYIGKDKEAQERATPLAKMQVLSTEYKNSTMTKEGKNALSQTHAQ